MLTRSLSLDLASSSIRAVAVHPGWVKTDMVWCILSYMIRLLFLPLLSYQGGSHADIEATESVEGILSLIENFDVEKMNGNFYTYEGKPMEW